MKMQKSFSVLGTEGCFFEGEIPGTTCFVPNSLLTNGKLDEGQYVNQGWASLNIKAQPSHLGIGSHLFPNLRRPFTNNAVCEQIKEKITSQRCHVATAS